MSWFLEKAYRFLWSMIPCLLLVGYLSNQTINIQMHDTYFVITTFSISVLLSVVFGIAGSIYWFMEAIK